MMDRVVANFSGKTYIFNINVLSIGLDTNDHQHLIRLLKSTNFYFRGEFLEDSLT